MSDQGKTSEPFVIHDELTVYEAGALRLRLLEFLQREGELRIDLSQVGVCDTAGVQLLCSLHKSASAAGRKLRFERPSALLLETLDTLGLGISQLNREELGP